MARTSRFSQEVRQRSGARSALSMKVNPLYEFLRVDPRFQELLRRIGLESDASDPTCSPLAQKNPQRPTRVSTRNC